MSTDAPVAEVRKPTDPDPNFSGFSILTEILENLVAAAKGLPDAARAHLETLIQELKDFGPAGPSHDVHLDRLGALSAGKSVTTVQDVMDAIKSLPKEQLAVLAAALAQGRPAVGSAGAAIGNAQAAAQAQADASAQAQADQGGTRIPGAAGQAQVNVQEIVDAALAAQLEQLTAKGYLQAPGAAGSAPQGEPPAAEPGQ